MNDEQWTIDHRDMNFGFSISDFGIFIPHSAFPACPAGGRNPQSKGFTLIELILVMVIIGILAAIVLPRTNVTLTSGTSVSGAAYMIASDIRYTQECAMATRTSKTVTFSAGGNTYSFSPANNLDPSGQLPSGATTGALTLTFNSLGEPTSIPAVSPYYVDLTVSAGGLTKTVRIWCFTGKATIL